MKDAGAYEPAFKLSRGRLKQLSPEEISLKSLVLYDKQKVCFYLESLGEKFFITYPEGRVFSDGSDRSPSIEWSLVLLNYLSMANNIPLVGQWVSYRDLPQGSIFFPSIEAYVLQVLAQFFTKAKEELLQGTLLSLGFKPVSSKADYDGIILFSPLIPCRIQYWEGDDEVPASFQILFDRSISRQLHIEDIAVICSVIKDLLIKKYYITESSSSTS